MSQTALAVAAFAEIANKMLLKPVRGMAPIYGENRHSDRDHHD